MSGLLTRAEFGLCEEKGGTLVGPAISSIRNGSEVFLWGVKPRWRSADGLAPKMDLLLRFTMRRPERAHLVLRLRGMPIARLDTFDGHRENGELLYGTHLWTLPDPAFPRGTTTFEIIPPLTGFPEEPLPGERVPYWIPVEWFCTRFNIDFAQLDRGELEKEVPHGDW